LSLRLLVDADTQADDLVRLLREAGNDILTANEAGLRTATDQIIFEHAHRESRQLLTRNVNDFRLLHGANPHHSGILAICEDQDRRKNMSYSQIVKAIANVESSGIELASQFIVLNAWNY